MKSNRPYPRAFITPKGERACRNGHPWVYDAEVERLEAPNGSPAVPDNGALVDVLSRKGSYIGTGILSLNSKIRIRLLTTNANDAFDDAFWERKIRWAWEHRKAVMGDDASACRMIFSEADAFCGLVVDRFSDVLVTQTLAYGMERLKPVVFPLLAKVLADDGIRIRGIYERNDVSTRALEGLEQTCGWFPLASGTGLPGEGAETGGVRADGNAFPSSRPAAANPPSPLSPDSEAGAAFGPTTVDIVENGVRYHVDFEHGQKTGFFLDQKYNRRAVAALAKGMRVLDCFTHTGSFALNAAMGGAEHVHAVDISQLAVDMAAENARLNGLDDRMEFTAANVFDLLPEVERQHRAPYDFIVLDPPAFTKSRRTIDSATRGYHEINYRAMKALPRGGYLATCSCSHFMDTERFRAMLASAAHDAGVQLRQVEERQQAPDHPIVWGIPETDYLKFFIFQVV